MDKDDGLEQARKRLRTLWGQLSLTPDEAVADKQIRALEPLYAWLSAEEDEAIVRAVQLLLLDPENPSVHHAAEAKRISSVIGDAWETASTRPQYVPFMQAMVIACWPEHAEGHPWNNARLFDPVWEAIARPENIKGLIETWRASPADFVDKVPSDIQSNSTSDGTYDEGIEWLNREGRYHDYDEDHDRIRALLRGLVTQPAPKQQHPQVELLWWGQAKYAKHLKVPFRRIDWPGKMTLHLAADVVDIVDGSTLPMAPTAAYLAEVAHTLGLRWDEERPLRGWLEEIAPFLIRGLDWLHVEPQPIIDGGATGLPILWLACGGDRRVEGVPEACGISTDVMIDRAAWLRWLLCELTLGRVLSQ